MDFTDLKRTTIEEKRIHLLRLGACIRQLNSHQLRNLRTDLELARDEPTDQNDVPALEMLIEIAEQAQHLPRVLNIIAAQHGDVMNLTALAGCFRDNEFLGQVYPPEIKIDRVLLITELGEYVLDHLISDRSIKKEMENVDEREGRIQELVDAIRERWDAVTGDDPGTTPPSPANPGQS